MSNDCGVDIRQVDEMFRFLSKENIDKVLLDALKQSGKELVEQTKQTMIKKLGSTATSTRNYNKRPKNSAMVEGVKSTVDKDYLTVVVSILKDFRAKWFERGTKQRKLLRTGAKDRERGRMSGDRRYLYRKEGKENFYKAGANRGKIEPHYFFRETVDSYDYIKITEHIDKTLQNLINQNDKQ